LVLFDTNERYMVTRNLTPTRLWYHFEKMSGIPRCSGREERVSRYVTGVADMLGLAWRRDGSGNVLIEKPASRGRGNAPVVVLQSHLDMVCETNRGSSHDFERDAIRLSVAGGWVGASGTSLGADNGIGAAAMLALLEEEQLECGPLELLYTVEEETGLTGVKMLEEGFFSGRVLINLDGDEYGTLTIGCAGGRDSDFFISGKGAGGNEREQPLAYFRVAVTGLRGGHSGAEIHLGRANAVKELGRLLGRVRRKSRLFLLSIEGGDKHNAIPREAFAVIAVPAGNSGLILSETEGFAGLAAREYGAADPDITVKIDETGEGGRPLPSTQKVIDLIEALPQGVLSLSPLMEGLVETSTNVSSIRTREDGVRVHASHRSSSESGMEGVAGMHRSIAEMLGTPVKQDEGYPAWEPDFDSPLLLRARDAFRAVSGRDPKVRTVHAGLEPGVLTRKYGGMDAVSFGPNIENAHSPDEKVQVESVREFYMTLTALLRMLSVTEER
jgi:dipeptidase D